MALCMRIARIHEIDLTIINRVDFTVIYYTYCT